jgi:hypothetical protein
VIIRIFKGLPAGSESNPDSESSQATGLDRYISSDNRKEITGE